MSQNKRISLFLSVFLLASFSSGCTNAENELENEEPNEDVQIDEEAADDFNFSLNYGPYGKQKVDTFEDIVIKDLVVDGTVEASISLSSDEMEQIYREMIKLDIMQISEMDADEQCASEPPSVSAWTIQMNDETNNFSFDVCYEPSEAALELLELETLIHEMVSSKDEYKELPKSVGGYE